MTVDSRHVRSRTDMTLPARSGARLTSWHDIDRIEYNWSQLLATSTERELNILCDVELSGRRLFTKPSSHLARRPRLVLLKAKTRITDWHSIEDVWSTWIGTRNGTRWLPSRKLRCIPAFQLISHWKTHSQLSLTQITRTALGPAWTATPLLRNSPTNSFHPGSGHPPSGTPRSNCSLSGWSSLNQLTMPPTELFHQPVRKMCLVPNTLLSPEVPCALVCHAGRRRTTRSFSTLSAHFTHTQLGWWIQLLGRL